VLSGADDWDDIEEFGLDQLNWLRKFGQFTHGIPSHNTINRVFSAIESKEFGRCFTQWVESINTLCDKEVVAIDGKRICNSYDYEKSAIHMVSAFASESGLCLGQLATDAKSNEITAIPQLLDILNIENCIVSIDAMGCQKNIATKVINRGANYLLAVKGNQSEMESNIEDTIRFTKADDTNLDTDSGHGRIETRHCSVYKNLTFIENSDQWENLKTIVRIDSQRVIKATGNTEHQTHYYISSLDDTAKNFNNWVRAHWGIENKLHWVLDVTFKEDYSRKRQGFAAENFNIILKIAMALLANNTSIKASKKRKRLKAALNHSYREELLNF
jgi:predicted transposase YbfD/YdcC